MFTFQFSFPLFTLSSSSFLYYFHHAEKNEILLSCFQLIDCNCFIVTELHHDLCTVIPAGHTGVSWMRHHTALQIFSDRSSNPLLQLDNISMTFCEILNQCFSPLANLSLQLDSVVQHNLVVPLRSKG